MSGQKFLAITLVVTALSGCSQQPAEDATVAPVVNTDTVLDPEAIPNPGSCEDYNEYGKALFGDVHVHTSFSFDAAANSTGATPIDAHRFARGESIPFFPLDASGKPTGSIKIDRPLDFLAVTDHGEFLGERALCRTENSPVYPTEFCVNYRANERQGMMMLGTVITTETPARIPEICGADGAQCREYARSPWQQIQHAANSAYEPCAFTSFIAYEYTGTPGTSNYHRNVIFRGDAVPELPVSYIDAPIDSKLWAGLDAVCDVKDGCDYLTIPHNSNLANGRMAPYRQLEPNIENKRKYAAKRLEREPIMEIFQHKGSSECVNGLTSILGAPDELCEVEAVRHIGKEKTYTTRTIADGALQLGQATELTIECTPGEEGSNGMLGAGCVDPTDFQRSALVVGLKEEVETGLNPIKLGVIASTDTHSATPGAVLESNWGGAVTGESTSAERLQPGLLTSGIDGNPGGLAGVWATQNTRDAIFDAMLRREVFGTSGPRIKPRLFAGFSLPDDLCERTDMIERAYADGVPMGADLKASAGSLKIFAHAAKDPNGQDLSEMHLIKGWVDAEGQMHTTATTIAASRNGSPTLCTVYTDESYTPNQSTYYYLRVVEPPSPRWHTYDCAAIAEKDRPDVCASDKYPDTVQEMAWTSPIWTRAE
jgi:hypothetical protein